MISRGSWPDNFSGVWPPSDTITFGGAFDIVGGVPVGGGVWYQGRGDTGPAVEAQQHRREHGIGKHARRDRAQRHGNQRHNQQGSVHQVHRPGPCLILPESLLEEHIA